MQRVDTRFYDGRESSGRTENATGLSMCGKKFGE
jgi:hypothetical protein